VSTFDRWREADQRWLESNRDSVESVFQWFLREGQWPLIGPFARSLFQRGVRSLDPQEVADAKPHVPAQLSPARNERFTLQARHLLELPSAQPFLRMVVDATTAAVEAYGSVGDVPMVAYDHPLLFSYDSDTVIRLPRLIEYDYPNVFEVFLWSDTWTARVNGSLVRDFDGVSNPTDYVNRQLGIIKRWADE